MSRCIEKDDCGNWSLRGFDWKELRKGQVITNELFEALYGALWKLMEYEDIDPDPDKLWNAMFALERIEREISLLPRD